MTDSPEQDTMVKGLITSESPYSLRWGNNEVTVILEGRREVFFMGNLKGHVGTHIVQTILDQFNAAYRKGFQDGAFVLGNPGEVLPSTAGEYPHLPLRPVK